MYRNMEQWSEIRRRVLVDGGSRRQILRETKMHWLTLKKVLEHREPPGCRQQTSRCKTKLGDYLGRLEQILKADQAMPRKQRPTAKRIWERLRVKDHLLRFIALHEQLTTTQAADDDADR